MYFSSLIYSFFFHLTLAQHRKTCSDYVIADLEVNQIWNYQNKLLFILVLTYGMEGEISESDSLLCGIC